MVDEHATTYENPFKFSGKELDDITGLYDHGARSRDPKITMWYGVDPLYEKYPDMSPYVYCHNNPVRYVDPTGMGEENVNGGTLPEVEVTADVPSGEMYKSEGTGGCTPASIKSMLDFFKMEYNRPIIDKARTIPGAGFDINRYYNRFRGNIIDSELLESKHEEVNFETIEYMCKNMKSEGLVYIVTLAQRQTDGKTIVNHTMVVNDVRMNVNAKGRVTYSIEYIDSISGKKTAYKKYKEKTIDLYILKIVSFRRKDNYNPWNENFKIQ
ncbi:MAG: RHS repeat-associated core domain-containing protein [Prevotellaceae bacterium]|nr:RHS repeat-associated core domain-containing protein [Prevotellaceae bacterium]